MAEDDRDRPRAWLRMLVRLGAPIPTMCLANALVGYAAPKLTCTPGQSTVASITGLSDGTIREHLRRLKAAGALTTKRLSDAAGRSAGNAYTFTWPTDEAAAARVLGAKSEATRRSDPTGAGAPVGQPAQEVPPTGAAPEPTGSVCAAPTGAHAAEEAIEAIRRSKREKQEASPPPSERDEEEAATIARAVEIAVAHKLATAAEPLSDKAQARYRASLQRIYTADPDQARERIDRAERRKQPGLGDWTAADCEKPCPNGHGATQARMEPDEGSWFGVCPTCDWHYDPRKERRAVAEAAAAEEAKRKAEDAARFRSTLRPTPPPVRSPYVRIYTPTTTDPAPMGADMAALTALVSERTT